MGIEHSSDEQIYFLDLPTLMTILSRQKRSGTLQVNQVRIPHMRGTVSLLIAVEHGVVRHCQITQKQKVLMNDEAAYRVALALQPLEWHWQALPVSSVAIQTSPLREFSPGVPSTPIARERMIIARQTQRAQDPLALQQLSRQHRRILALCDGTRSLDKIANILVISLQDLAPYIQDLGYRGYIQLYSV